MTDEVFSCTAVGRNFECCVRRVQCRFKKPTIVGAPIFTARSPPSRKLALPEKQEADNFDIPQDLQNYLNELESYREHHQAPGERGRQHSFFDHRREDADGLGQGGLPNEVETLLAKAKRLADGQATIVVLAKGIRRQRRH